MPKPLRKWLTLWLLPPAVLVTCAAMCSTAGSCSAIPLKEYDPAFTQQWLKETEGLSDDSAVARYMTDARALRDAVRACKGR